MIITFLLGYYLAKKREDLQRSPMDNDCRQTSWWCVPFRFRQRRYGRGTRWTEVFFTTVSNEKTATTTYLGSSNEIKLWTWRCHHEVQSMRPMRRWWRQRRRQVLRFLSIQGGAPTNSYVEDPCFGHPYHIKGWTRSTPAVPSAAMQEVSVWRRVSHACVSGIAIQHAKGIIGRSIKKNANNGLPSFTMRRCSKTHRRKRTAPFASYRCL